MPAQSSGATAARIEIGGDGVGEALVDDVVVGVAAHGDGAVDAILGGVGERGALVAEMFFAAVAGSAVAAGVDDDADGGDVSELEFFGRVSDRDHSADDLVAGDHGIDRIAPLVAGHVQVRMADAAVEDFNGDFSGAGLAAAEAVGSKRRLGVERCIAFG